MEPASYQPMTESEVVKLLASGAELRGIELREADLSRAAVPQLVVRDCRFVDVLFGPGDFEELECGSSSFVRCRFDDADLTSARFTRCSFFDPDTAAPCTFIDTVLRFAAFQDCTLDSCVFTGADLHHVTLRESRAIGTNFAGAQFGGAAVLTQNVLRYADLRQVDLAHCDLTHNDLEWAVLERANLRQANLRDSSLNRASIRATDFRGADLRNTNLGGLDPRHADLRDAIIFEAQMRQLVEALGLFILPDA